MPQEQIKWDTLSKAEKHDVLLNAAKEVLESHDQTGCTFDLTVVDAASLCRLQDALHYYANIDAGEPFVEDTSYEDALEDLFSDDDDEDDFVNYYGHGQ